MLPGSRGVPQRAAAACSETVSPILAQVMKIVVTLMVEEAGRVHYVKRPGALLEAGCVIARLELDDPTKVKPVSLLRLATLLSPPLLSNPKQHPMGQQRNCPGSGMGRDVPMALTWPCNIWLLWGSCGCSPCHGVALYEHPMHIYLL